MLLEMYKVLTPMQRSRLASSRLSSIAVAIALGVCTTTHAQQTGLTDAQIRSANVEVPRLVELLGLQSGMSVADVGAGFGAWTTRLAREVGPSGRIYATDVGAVQIAALRDITSREHLNNVIVIEGAVNSTNLPAVCCDSILIRDAYHHLTQPEAIIKSLAASLKPGGLLAVIDFPPRPNSDVPPGVPANRGGHGVPAEVVEREIGTALTHVRTMSAWSPASEPASLYLVLFRKP